MISVCRHSLQCVQSGDSAGPISLLPTMLRTSNNAFTYSNGSSVCFHVYTNRYTLGALRVIFTYLAVNRNWMPVKGGTLQSTDKTSEANL